MAAAAVGDLRQQSEKQVRRARAKVMAHDGEESNVLLPAP